MSDTDDILKGLGVDEEPTVKTRTRASRPPAADKDPLDTPKWRTLRGQVADLYGAVAMGSAAFGDQFSAQIIASNADQLADAWVKLAYQNPRVERMLKMLTETSAVGTLVMAHLGVIIPILVFHGKMPGGAVMGLGNDQSPNGNGASSN